MCVIMTSQICGHDSSRQMCQLAFKFILKVEFGKKIQAEIKLRIKKLAHKLIKAIYFLSSF